ncbi:MAG TPA: DUF2905 domain-containing protein [Chitinophagaceae bacterium]
MDAKAATGTIDNARVLILIRAMDQNTGKYILLFGLLIVLIGVIVYFFHDRFHWIGRLPGDIRIEKENFRFYFPITTMILASLLITLIVNIIRRFF